MIVYCPARPSDGKPHFGLEANKTKSLPLACHLLPTLGKERLLGYLKSFSLSPDFTSLSSSLIPFWSNFWNPFALDHSKILSSSSCVASKSSSFRWVLFWPAKCFRLRSQIILEARSGAAPFPRSFKKIAYVGCSYGIHRRQYFEPTLPVRCRLHNTHGVCQGLGQRKSNFHVVHLLHCKASGVCCL